MENLTPYYSRLAALVIVALSGALSACGGNSSTANAPVNRANDANASAPANANTAKAAPKSPLEGIVAVSAENVEARAGGTAQAVVRLAITSGYHVNANPAAEKFLIPTSLEVKPEAGITVDKIVYPKPLTKKFSFSKVPLTVYEGDTRITMTIRVPPGIAPGQHTLAASLRAQACDDEKCYPPATANTSIPVTIR
ncbi:MAG TPA: protein-disulfide reductase DsbD domain-containing protein [Pyrinomonadaceae bacterium]|nr:protein-disulfide reductase DsbD domain-containing protein [Pyrinomonadaceae bacterium]